MFTENSKYLKFISFAAALVVFSLISSYLAEGVNFLIPIILGIVCSYLIVTLVKVFEKVPFGKGKTPHFLAIIYSVLVLIFSLWLVVSIVRNNFIKLAQDLPVYQEKLQEVIDGVFVKFNIPKMEYVDIISKFDFSDILTKAAFEFGGMLSLWGAVSVYILFFLIEYKVFDKKIKCLFKNQKQRDGINQILARINTDTQTYIKVQSLISLATGLLAYIILLLFGVHFAAFWGLLTFVLNFIPIFGSILATIFPIMFAIVDLGSFPQVAILLCLLFGVQFILGNIISPKMMGKTLNLSPLVILIALSLWGTIWGITGAFLSIPIMVILNISFAQFKSTRWISILLSENGNIPDHI
ncbi:AI-2E family transporter [Candidatus Parcubacteria bacterium]|nr:AI-2E family transporter [Candidatus Parcubacteria bacterium]